VSSLVIFFLSLLAITVVGSGGFVGSVYAHENLKVDCKDLALALFSRDRAFGILDQMM
jgi:hypothetical protein